MCTRMIYVRTNWSENHYAARRRARAWRTRERDPNADEQFHRRNGRTGPRFDTEKLRTARTAVAPGFPGDPTRCFSTGRAHPA